MLKKITLITLALLTIGIQFFAFNTSVVKADDELTCFVYEATWTNPNAQYRRADLNIRDQNGATVYSVPTSLPGSSTQSVHFEGWFRGSPYAAYTTAVQEGPFGVFIVSNVSIQYSPCTADNGREICFTYSATWTNHEAADSQGTLFIYAVESDGAVPFPNVTYSEQLFSATARINGGESRVVEFEGSFLHRRGELVVWPYFFDYSHQHDLITESNQVIEYTDCTLPSSRVNVTDVAAPAALYINGDMVQVYYVDPITAEGTIAINVTVESVREVSAQAVASGQNQLIAENMGVGLYALSTGECQVNGFYSDGNVYDFTFPCP